jgi:hypothetical protein
MKLLCVLTWCLFSAAIAVDFAGKGYYSIAAQTIARAAGQDQAAKMGANQEAHAAIRVGGHYQAAGILLAGLGLAAWFASWITAKAKAKRLTPAVPLILSVAYILLHFVIV